MEQKELTERGQDPLGYGRQRSHCAQIARGIGSRSSPRSRSRCADGRAGGHDGSTNRPQQSTRGCDAANLNGALRGLHEPEIIDDKLAASRVILDTIPSNGGKVVLTPAQAESWLMGLNDVRLALGTTLGIDADTPEVLDEGDPRAPHLDVYHWLTWMQDSLVQVLIP